MTGDKIFEKVYVEITDVCNLNCSFCKKTKRQAAFLSEEEFSLIAGKLRPFTSYLYFHLMGEPLLHPKLEKLLEIAEKKGFRVNLTTNGTLIKEKSGILLNSPGLRKVSVSLHSFEANPIPESEIETALEKYLTGIWNFAESFRGITELRLWNGGGENALNGKITDFLSEKAKTDVLLSPVVKGSLKIREKLYLVFADRFEWPSEKAGEKNTKTCFGLKNHIGILCDGTVVPCCLDSDGTMALGNILRENLADILSSPRAKRILYGFEIGKPAENLCRRCGYAQRFTK